MRSKPPARLGRKPKPTTHGPVNELAVWITIGSGVLTGVSVTLILWSARGMSHKDALDAGMKITLAIIGLLGAILGVRRYNLSEREHLRLMQADEHARADAIARQITELSAKASEQLGSSKAAVRMGGLTDLERLARTYPDLRQVVVDRLCAYLRGPYSPPPNVLDSERVIIGDQTEEIEAEVSQDDVDRRLELDVRRMIQKILRRHLLWPQNEEEPSTDYWEGLEIDLSGAALVELNFSHCRIGSFTASNATFYGGTLFDGAQFMSGTWMPWTEFKSQASFTGTYFLSLATFHGARFHGITMFDEAIFNRATFDRATFSTEMGFHPAHFKYVGFKHVRFENGLSFNGNIDGRNIGLDRADIPTSSIDDLPPGWTAHPVTSSPDRSVVARRRKSTTVGSPQT